MKELSFLLINIGTLWYIFIS